MNNASRTHKIRDVEFGLAFPLPPKSQLAPRLSTASSRSSRSSLPGQPSKPLLGSNQGSPEGTLRRQRSDSAIGDGRESSVISKGSTSKRGRPPGGCGTGSIVGGITAHGDAGSSALRRSTTAYDDSAQKESPVDNALENEAGENEGSEEEEDIPLVAARTPTLKLVLKRKRDSSPAEDSRISINRRRSQISGPSMVDELEDPSPGLFLTPRNERQTAQPQSRSSRISGSRVTSIRDREQFRTPTGQIVTRPGSSHAIEAIHTNEDEPEDEELHDSIHSGNVSHNSLGIAQAEDEEVDELAAEVPVAEEETHEQDTALPTTIPARPTIPQPEPKRKTTTQQSLNRNQARSAPSSLRQQAARNIRRSKGAQVLVYRLANTQHDTSNAPNPDVNGEEEGEDILSTAPKFIRRPGVNAVDVLNQLCRELIETHLETLHDRGIDEPDPQRRSELRHHRKAIEGFGQELEDRCFELVRDILCFVSPSLF